jgi:hypothetical protein
LPGIRAAPMRARDCLPMLLRHLPLLFACALLAATPARADGTIYRVNGCGDYIFVSSSAGDSVLVGSGGASGEKEGDTLTGNVEQIGHASLLDQTTGRSVFAQIVDHRLTLAEVTQRIASRCRDPIGDRQTSGYVSRAINCGSKIFVNTDRGYAMLERITGGIVADGDTLTGNFNRPGRATMKDQQTGGTLIVFVQDLWLSKSAAERRMTANCRASR